jgi:hypothetical protein
VIYSSLFFAAKAFCSVVTLASIATLNDSLNWKKDYQRTFSSLLLEAYVLNKARELTREFSYRDFLELKHDASAESYYV